MWVLLFLVVRGIHAARSRVRPQDSPQLQALEPLLGAFLPYWVSLVTNGQPDGQGIPNGPNDVGGVNGDVQYGLGGAGLDIEANLFNMSDLTTPSRLRAPGSPSASNFSWGSDGMPPMLPNLRLNYRTGLAGIHQPPRIPRGTGPRGRGSRGPNQLPARPPTRSEACCGGILGATCPSGNEE